MFWPDKLVASLVIQGKPLARMTSRHPRVVMLTKLHKELQSNFKKHLVSPLLLRSRRSFAGQTSPPLRAWRDSRVGSCFDVVTTGVLRSMTARLLLFGLEKGREVATRSLAKTGTKHHL